MFPTASKNKTISIVSFVWIKDLNLRPDTIHIKLSEENIGRTLSESNQSKIFFDPSSRVMEIKTKINKRDLIKLKGFAQQRKP